MASTITPATLTVKITETISINGSPHGATNTKTIASINEISKRILTITTNEAVIATFSGAVASSGHFNDSFVRYMRFTNLDDTNHIVLFFTNENHDEFAVKLDKGQSFIFNSDLSGGGVDTLDANFGGEATASGLGDLTKVSIQSDTASCDVEYFVAST